MQHPVWSVPGSMAEPEAEAPPRPADGEDVSVAPPAGAGAPPGTFAATGPLTDREAAAAVPQLKLQPMTVADILDGAFTIIKARPARILGLTSVFVVPVHLFAAFVQRNVADGGLLWDAFDSDDPAVLADASRNTSGAEQFWATLFLVLVPALALVFVAAAVARMVAAWSVGRDMPAGELLSSVGRRAWPLLASYVLVHVLETIGIIGCYVGPLLVMAFFSVTAPAIGAEGLGPLAAMKRSYNLTSRRYWAVLGISVGIGFVALLLDLALGGLPDLLTYFVDFEVAWPLRAAGNILGAVISTPFVAAATVLLYLDLRIRTEGLDIELATIDMANHAR